MTSVTLAVRRRPLTSFWVLACLFSWWPVPLFLLHVFPVPNASFGPFLAALVVLALTEGRAGIGRLLRSMIRWRVPVRWYVLAIGLPLLASGIGVLATVLTGGHADRAGLLAWPQILLVLAISLLIPGYFGAWEEPGFRGYALPRIEARFGLVAGPLILGAGWVLWHLPLFLAGQILLPDVLVILAASVVFAAVFDSARKSVLIVMIMHAANNGAGGGWASGVFTGADGYRLGLWTAAAWWVMAAAVLVHRWTRPAEIGDPVGADLRPPQESRT